MNEELQEKLFKNYPEIFKGKDLSETESCMLRGVDTGDGWFGLIDTLCEALQAMTNESNYPQVVAEQVKNKFGILRFYFRTEPTGESKQYNPTSSIEYLKGMVSFAEKMSKTICEECGAPGKRHGLAPRAYVRCDACLEKLGDFRERRPSTPVWKMHKNRVKES